MLTNRIRTRYVTQNEPAQAPVAGIPAGFVITPQFLMAAAAVWQWQLYQAAYEEARRTAAVPRHYRRFFSVWNQPLDFLDGLIPNVSAESRGSGALLIGPSVANHLGNR